MAWLKPDTRRNQEKMLERSSSQFIGNASTPGALHFRCNICGSENIVPAKKLSREESSCNRCQSSVRMRGMIHALSLALFNRSLVISDFPDRKDLVGKGMSDWDGYALPLARKLSYQNTYYHKEPLLDITRISDSDRNSVDFLLSTDVFEHVAPPVSLAFENARAMLRENGAFILSVPYTFSKNTVEHFPNLFDYSIEQRNGRRVLCNRTRNGELEEFDNLVFHGGEGDTLELRVFCESGLLDELHRAGFHDVKIVGAPFFEYGIYWPKAWSLPIIARAASPAVSVEDWGPTSSAIASPANRQQNGRSAIWVRLAASIGDGSPKLLVGGHEADGIVAHDKLITALIPESIVKTPGSFPVTLAVVGFPPVYVGDFDVYD
jgi:hypothetical protein